MPARRTASATTSAPSCGRGELLQRAEKLSGGRPHRGDDDRIAHDGWLKRTGTRATSGSAPECVVTVCSPSRCCRRARMTRAERATSRDHCALAVSTTRTSPSSRTAVARCSAGPTAAFQAKSTLPGDSGRRPQHRGDGAGDSGSDRIHRTLNLESYHPPCASFSRQPRHAAPSSSAPPDMPSTRWSSTSTSVSGPASRRRTTCAAWRWRRAPARLTSVPSSAGRRASA